MKKLFRKVKSCLLRNRKALLTFCMVGCLALVTSVSAFASDGTVTVVTPDDFSGVLTALQVQISVATIVQVLVVLVGATVGLAFMWWGVRKLTAALMKAFKKGKVSV